MAEQTYSWTEFLAMDESTLVGFLERGDGIPFVQHSMARRALSEVRRRAWAEMQRQYSVLEEHAAAAEGGAQANGHAAPTDAAAQEAGAAGPVEDPMRRALALSEEALATARDANAFTLTSAALIERQNQRVRWANMISIFAAVVALIGMWRG